MPMKRSASVGSSMVHHQSLLVGDGVDGDALGSLGDADGRGTAFARSYRSQRAGSGGTAASTLEEALDLRLEARGTNVTVGFLQAMAVARALLKTTAQIVILDDCLNQIEPNLRNEVIYPGLFAYAKEMDLTLVIVTHDLKPVKMVEHVVVLNKGSIEHQGSYAELREKDVPFLRELN